MVGYGDSRLTHPTGYKADIYAYVMVVQNINRELCRRLRRAEQSHRRAGRCFTRVMTNLAAGYPVTARSRSPDGEKRNPGMHHRARDPDCAAVPPATLAKVRVDDGTRK